VSKMRTRSYIYYDNERNSAVGIGRLCAIVCFVYFTVYYTLYIASLTENPKKFPPIDPKTLARPLYYVRPQSRNRQRSSYAQWLMARRDLVKPVVVLFVRMECTPAHSCVAPTRIFLPRWNRLRFLCECCGNRLEN